jgi:hypothetical protein
MLLDVRQRTNQENSTFVTDAELTEWLNQEIAAIEVKLALNQSHAHFRSLTTIDVVPPTALYALPATFWALQEVMATVGGITGSLMPFMLSEHGLLSNPALAIPGGPPMYRIQAGNIEFRPATQAFTATVYFTPTQARLVAGSDSWDGFNGYEMAAIYGTCAQVYAKEESDPGFFMAKQAEVYAHIAAASAHRDMANPERVQDVTDGGMRMPNGAFGWWG